jgi:hypothetical protein
LAELKNAGEAVLLLNDIVDISDCPTVTARFTADFSQDLSAVVDLAQRVVQQGLLNPVDEFREGRKVQPIRDVVNTIAYQVDSS